MSDNFRSSYYGSLGVSSIAVAKPPSSLDVLIKADILGKFAQTLINTPVVFDCASSSDVEKLKSVCMLHPLETFHRPLVWKTILG